LPRGNAPLRLLREALAAFDGEATLSPNT